MLALSQIQALNFYVTSHHRGCNISLSDSTYPLPLKWLSLCFRQLLAADNCFCYILNNLYAVQAKTVRTLEISNIKILMKIAGSSPENKQLLYVFLHPPLVKQKKKKEGRVSALLSFPFLWRIKVSKTS